MAELTDMQEHVLPYFNNKEIIAKQQGKDSKVKAVSVYKQLNMKNFNIS